MATIRIVARECDVGDAVHCDGGKATTTYWTFDLPCPAEFAEWLSNRDEWRSRSIVGVEIISAETPSE